MPHEQLRFYSDTLTTGRLSGYASDLVYAHYRIRGPAAP